jgi:hypothetical protein
MTSKPGVRRFARKTEDFHPWFGTRSDLKRLISVAAELCADRGRFQSGEGPDGKDSSQPMREQGSKEMVLEVIAHEPGESISGDAESVIEQIDPRRLLSIEVKGRSKDFFADERTRLVMEVTTYKGVSFSVASDDINWVSQSFGRLYDEARKGRHPRWAALSSDKVRFSAGLIGLTSGLSAGTVGMIAARHVFDVRIAAYFCRVNGSRGDRMGPCHSSTKSAI